MAESVTSLFGEEKKAPQQRCELCAEAVDETVTLYGHPVCGKCARDFASRRALAFLIDYILLLLVYPLWFVSLELSERYTTWILLGYVVLPLKDGFWGYSPGKIVLGVRAYSRTSGRPIGPVLSFMRNVWIYIPLAPLIAALQLERGPRLGDGFANTRVIWMKYAQSKVFALSPQGARVQTNPT